ncbi:hypothetical protein M404DRAFT_999636, partial [Pisolithus tinctorius Marx 270]
MSAISLYHFRFTGVWGTKTCHGPPCWVSGRHEGEKLVQRQALHRRCSIANSTRETLAVFTLLITSGKCPFSYLLRHQMQLTQVGSVTHAEHTVVRMCVGH